MMAEACCCFTALGLSEALSWSRRTASYPAWLQVTSKLFPDLQGLENSTFCLFFCISL